MRNHRPFIVFFLILLITGLWIYKDYGISWDEPISRDNNGVFNYNFMVTGDADPVLKGNEKYHGPSFEIFLVAIEKVFSMKDSRTIYLMRHLITFLVHAISVLFFYILCFKYFKSKYFALIASVLLVLSPRIFADAFYNSKDLTFMSFTIFSMFTTLIFLEKKSYRTAIIHGLITAFLIDIRILGIIFPGFTFLFLLFDFIKSKEERKKIIISGLFFLVSLVGFMILFWPVLWLGPIKHFILAWEEMRFYPWNGTILFMGQIISSTKMPWEYMPVWILISTPVLYTILFVTGLYFILRKFIKSFILSRFEWLNLYVFAVPLLAVIVLHSVVYDGWRHLYFIYPSFIVLAVIGLQGLITLFGNNEKRVRILKGGIWVYCLFMTYIIIKLHPYQQIYFNCIAGKNFGEIQKNYEGDYWGLSFKEGIDHILKTDSAVDINIFAEEAQCFSNNLKIQKENDRFRLSETIYKELADYFITISRSIRTAPDVEPDFAVVRDKGTLFYLYDLRNKNVTSIWDKYRIAHYETDFESPSEYWKENIPTNDTAAYSGNKVARIDSSMMYSTGISIKPMEVLTDTNKANYVSVEVQIKNSSDFDMDIIFQIDSANGGMYNWQARGMKSYTKRGWRKMELRSKVPEVHSLDDIIKIYLWKHSRNPLLIDDLKVSFYSIPQKEVLEVMNKFQ